MSSSQSVWIFHGAQGRFSSGAFTSVKEAENWIIKYKLSGMLTEYPLDVGIYDWAIEAGLFEVKKDTQKSAEFIQTFTSGSQEHFHYENGKKE